ncbi:MAG: phenylacetate-CoA oxygenase subunit PaaJ [Bacteroidetes bacterium]|nr:MAG: phenylacetate-CoA oxygenase subunit PaaJ [Bacteroidota bacterium]
MKSLLMETTLPKEIAECLATVTDPEIPVLTVLDLGVVRGVKQHPDGTLEVFITPTYTGCPAMRLIEMNIAAALHERGYENVKVTTVLAPPWTTDWISEEGRRKLREFGIAPPQRGTAASEPFDEKAPVPCPRCGSHNTRLVSQFGSTACKSLFKCLDCLEPFDYFKCH